MAEKLIEVKKELGYIGKRKFTLATLIKDGQDKWDIRKNPTDKNGIRFSDEGINQLAKIQIGEIDADKSIKATEEYTIHADLGEVDKFHLYAMTWLGGEPTYDFGIVHNGKLVTRTLSKTEMGDLMEILADARKKSASVTMSMAECLKVYEPEVTHKTKGETRKKSVDSTEVRKTNSSTTVGQPTEKKEYTMADATIDAMQALISENSSAFVNMTVKQRKEAIEQKAKELLNKQKNKPKEYASGYDRFCDQFAKYRESLKEEWRASAELSHAVITDHIKEICESSAEYNQRCLLEWKNSANLMRFVQDKAYSSIECQKAETRTEYIQYLLQFTDEYIGSDEDKPKPKEEKTTKAKTTGAKRGRKPKAKAE